MNRPIASLVLLLAVMQSHAQLQIPARPLRQVQNPENVVVDRGANLEVFPTERAFLQSDNNGRPTIRSVSIARADSSIGPQQFGVVFNHAMQQQGYISGEIAFKLKAGTRLCGFSSSLYPGLKRIANPEVYVVSARTPAEFIAVLKRLQARGDLEWVEPTVTYGGAQQSISRQTIR